MYHLLGWLFIIVGGAIILTEVIAHLKNSFKPKESDDTRKYAIPNDIIVELIKKLPWVVVLGLILIYLGLYMVGAPVPFSIAIGNPTS